MAHNLRVPAHFGIRTERYKLIFFYGSTPAGGDKTPAAWELYDLKSDPGEMHNQYTNSKYATVVTELKTELRRLRDRLKETDDAYPPVQDIIEANWN